MISLTSLMTGNGNTIDIQASRDASIFMQKTNHSPSRHVYLDITMNIVRLSTAIFVEMIRDSGRIPQIGLVHVIVGQQLPQLLVRYTR